MNYDDMMPLDPFADDPNDPASFIEDDEIVEPLSPEASPSSRTLHTYATHNAC